MTLLEKLLKIQSELKAPKNQYNEFGGFSYRSCEDILSAAKPLCVQEGLLLYISDDVGLLGDRYYVKATATVTDGEDSFSVAAFARETESRPKMDAAQLTGSASSYARKYALNGLFCLDDTKDADAMKPDDEAPKAKPKAKAPAKKKEEPKAEQVDDKAVAWHKVLETAKRLTISKDDIKEIVKRRYNKNTWADLTDAEASDIAENLSDYAVEMIDEEALMMGEK